MSLDLRIFQETIALLLGSYKGDRDWWWRPHGHGVLKSKDLTYIGEFKHGKYHGTGTIKYADGGVFQGEFLDSMRNGKGQLKVGELDFNVEWKDNKPEGYGKLTVPGSAYHGYFQNGLRHGRGTLYNDKEIGRPNYEGEWFENKRHGKGLEWSDSESMMFNGTFENDQRNGEGNETTLA